jgi:hypothetical protein
MKIPTGWSKRPVACFLVLLMAFPLAETSAAMPQQAVSGQQAQTASSTPTEQQGPASPNPSVESSTPQSSTPQSSPPQSSLNQSNSDQQQNGVTRPVGTAAAPLEKPTGVTASRPAGAVIAPAKQHRVRAILIRVSIVVGAAVAVGTVVALSRASPSRPN